MAFVWRKSVQSTAELAENLYSKLQISSALSNFLAH